MYTHAPSMAGPVVDPIARPIPELQLDAGNFALEQDLDLPIVGGTDTPVLDTLPQTDPLEGLDPELQASIEAFGDDPLMAELLASPGFVESLTGVPIYGDDGVYGYGSFHTGEQALAKATHRLGEDMEVDNACLAFVSGAYSFTTNELNPPPYRGDTPATADQAWEYNLANANDEDHATALGETVYRDEAGEWDLPAGAPVFFDDGEEGSPGHVAIATGEFTEDGEPIFITTYYGEERTEEEGYPVSLATLSDIEGAVDGRTMSGFVQMPTEEGGAATVVPVSYDEPEVAMPADERHLPQ